MVLLLHSCMGLLAVGVIVLSFALPPAFALTGFPDKAPWMSPGLWPDERRAGDRRDDDRREAASDVQLCFLIPA